MHDLTEGRCHEWLNFSYEGFGHFDWSDRLTGNHHFVSPQTILETIRGSGAYIVFDENPLQKDKILNFISDIKRMNVEFEDWTTARCFWHPKEIKTGASLTLHHYLFFGTQRDILFIRMLLNP